MISQSLVSIIIPCYNAAAMIERCLNSCLQQTYSNIEIVLVDNNSQDGTMAIAQQLTCTTTYRVIFGECSQQGANSARNLGYILATGEYIQWLDADDELTPNKIALQVSALERSRNYDIAYGDWDWCFYRQGQHLATLSFQSLQYDDYLLQALVDNWQPPHTYLLRRSAAQRLHEILAWHPQTQVSQDREYFTLAALLGDRFVHVPNAKVRYNNWSQTQKTQSITYINRVRSLKTMFQRFQHHAAQLSESGLTAPHRFLLEQNWNLWSLNNVSLMQYEQGLWLANNSTGIKKPASLTEARIVSALRQLPGSCTLEDHARSIVRHLWKAIARSRGGESSVVVQQLNHLVGLPIAAGASLTTQQESLVWVIPQGKGITLNDRLALIDAVPLFAPIFGEQRLAILQVLERLRQSGWLKLATLKSSARSNG